MAPRSTVGFRAPKLPPTVSACRNTATTVYNLAPPKVRTTPRKPGVSCENVRAPACDLYCPNDSYAVDEMGCSICACDGTKGLPGGLQTE